MIHKKSYFYLDNEHVLKSVEDFINYLPIMPDAVFKAHVDSHKNDFADWIKHVFLDKELAHNIRPLKEKEELVYYFYKKDKGKKNKEQISELLTEMNKVKTNKKQKHIVKKVKEKIANTLNKGRKIKRSILDEALSPEKTIDTFANRIDLIKENLVTLRKRGKDVLIVKMYFDMALAKQRLLEVMYDDKAAEAMDLLLKKVEHEMQDLGDFEEIDVKKEILERAGIPITKHINQDD